MVVCPNCGQENPEGFRLCGMCGTPLETPERREERKVVTVLFADLVGFTSRAEQLDPEDVRAVLAPYHERLRFELERFGGTVEKFIGDAVMAVFGAPVAHEDDPERAVRAGLAIRDWAREERIELRVGINTGEALVTYGAEPLAAGDVVNTAARLQSAAPVNGILVGEKTHEATKQAIDYAEAEAVEAKGKAAPVVVWEALEARARFGVDVVADSRAPLVGRERELDTLRSALERAIAERTPQLVTLVGVPGIGKSRLVHELFRILESGERRELIRWRQGRSLPYGEGVTFWALAEMVKAEAGVLEGDSAESAASKLTRAVSAVIADDDAGWVERHLRPLVGAGDAGTSERGEAFAAWRRFVEALAEHHPTVLVFEDLQWADEALLDFVDELVDWSRDVPLLVICTARPELLERRPGWGGGKPDAASLSVRPLSDDQTAGLIAKLLDRPVLPAETQSALLASAGGNPLYAEQYARMLEERGETDAVPETVHGIIAARVDALSAQEKSLLQDAAVLGKVFWLGAVGGDPGVLHGLERKELVQRARRSSIAGETEYAFRHALVRDVAYGQIPRAERARRHRRAAEWIETLGRPEDHAEMLAHHWQAALQLAQAAGQENQDLVGRTRLALRAAADRAFSLHALGAAERYYTEALALWPAADPDRPDLLFRRARVLHAAGDDRREHALVEARDALLEAGDQEAAGEAEAMLARAAWYAGRREEVFRHLQSAEKLVGDAPASAAKARVLATSAGQWVLGGDTDRGLALAREALAMAEELGLDELAAHALTTIGTGLIDDDPANAPAALERAVEIAQRANLPEAARAVNNLAVAVFVQGDIARERDLVAQSQALAERFGARDLVRFAAGNLVPIDWLLGDWDRALREAEQFLDECVTSPHYHEGTVRQIRGTIRLGRDDVEGALADWKLGLRLARETGEHQALMPVLIWYVRGCVQLGRLEEAEGLAREALAAAATNPRAPLILGLLASSARTLGIELSELQRLVDLATETPWKQASSAQAAGDYRRAADIFAGFGARSLEAETRFDAAEDLLAAGRRAEGEAELDKALSFFRSVGATFHVRRAEALRETRVA